MAAQLVGAAALIASDSRSRKLSALTIESRYLLLSFGLCRFTWRLVLLLTEMWILVPPVRAQIFTADSGVAHTFLSLVIEGTFYFMKAPLCVKLSCVLWDAFIFQATCVVLVLKLLIPEGWV